MRTILTNVYKEAYPEATALPESVTVGDENWPHDNDVLSNRDVEELLEKFSGALPRDEAKTYEFTLKRTSEYELVNGEDNNNVRNLHFTEAVTISNATNLPDNDNYGGTIRFAGCSFDEGVTVICNPAYQFNVVFDESCVFNDDAKVEVVKAEGAENRDLLANNSVNVRFECEGGKVVSSACVDAQAADGVSYIFNGVTVSGSGTETNNNNDFFHASMNFNCAAAHSNDFDWGRNDHSQCSGAVSSQYQFTAYGNTEMTVSGTTAENLPIRLAGSVDISGLTALDNQEITLHNWVGGRINMEIGSNSVTVYDTCDNACINGVELSPHVFGRNRDGLFIGLQGAETVPTFTLKDADGKSIEFDTDNSQPGKVYLSPRDGGCFDDPSRLVLTVNYGGGSVTFNGIWWKPIYTDEFIELLNETLHLTEDKALTLNGLGVTENDYLTYGSAKTILSAAWPVLGGEDELDLGRIIDDGNYWGQLDWWQNDPNHRDEDSPEGWTLTWDDAERMLRRFRGELGMNSVEVTNAQELLNALAAGYTDIQVTKNIIIDFGDADEYNPHNVYLDRVDGVDEQVIYVQPGVTFTVGGTDGGENKVKMDIQDGVRMVLCADVTGHGVLCVNKGSCVNVFGSLETPNDLSDEIYNTYVVRAEGASVNYMKRIAELGGRLYDRLRESSKVEALEGNALIAHAGEDCWPDDDWNRQGMAFLEAYAGLTKAQDGDRTYWPSWDHARYGKVMELLGAVYVKLTGVDMPETVYLDDTGVDRVLDDYGVDTLIDRFMAELMPEPD